MTTVHRWTGLEARALRLALRMSVRAFAAHLGVGTRTVSKWEKLLSATEPRQDTQAILDTALTRAEPSVHLRFETSLYEAGRADGRSARPVARVGPRTWEYETWADDLDRSVVALSRQNFPFADDLLRRWLVRFPPPGLDEKGLYLHARTTALLGDVQRDQGTLLGPLSARRSYQDARTVFCRSASPDGWLSWTSRWPCSWRCPANWIQPPVSTRPSPSTTGSLAATGPESGCGWGRR